jgi:hypothetical protein
MRSAVCLEGAKQIKHINNWKLFIAALHAVMELVFYLESMFETQASTENFVPFYSVIQFNWHSTH